MKIFPDIHYKHDDYRTELARHLDDPLRKAICETLWHGTKQYQTFIARDGVRAQQEVLGQIRLGTRQMEGSISTLAENEPKIAADVEKLKQQAQELAKSEEYRHTGHGQLMLVDHSQRVAELMGKSVSNRNLWIQTRNAIAEKRKQLDMYRQVDERLTAALLTYMEDEQAKRDATPQPPPAPVINVNVAAPIVNLEATIDMPPPEVSINLPDRKTVTTIERDHHGNIIGSEQIETDA